MPFRSTIVVYTLHGLAYHSDESARPTPIMHIKTARQANLLEVTLDEICTTILGRDVHGRLTQVVSLVARATGRHCQATRFISRRGQHCKLQQMLFGTLRYPPMSQIMTRECDKRAMC